MKKFNKGMVITSTIAAAIAAMSLASCGNSAAEITKNEPAKAVQALANTAVAENSAKAADITAETNAETNTETRKEEKAARKETKKDTKKSDNNGVNTTAKVTAEPKVIIPQQDKNNTKKTEAPKTEAPTVIPEDVYPVWAEGDMYAGTYAEEIAGRGTMDITRNIDGTYSVQVDWSSSAFEKCSWTFSGEFNGRGVMHYNNCCKTTLAFDENGNYTYDSNGYKTPCINYSGGSGYIEFKDEGILEWHDDMGDILTETTYVICKRSCNTKADEAGTAGSCYYENEPLTKADEAATAGSCYYENENR